MPFDLFAGASEEYAGAEPSERKKPLWKGILASLAAILIGECIGQYFHHRQAFQHQGFKAFRWDDFFMRAVEAVAALICFKLLAQSGEITTLGIGQPTTRKLR